MKYDRLIIDTVNLAYKVFDIKEDKPLLVDKKVVYKDSICKFVKCVEDLKNKYLHFDGEIHLLVDNYFSRADLQSSFMFADRRELSEAYKHTRKKESKEFYNSINLIRYYYMIGPSNYTVSRIDGLEADDLVKPVLETFDKDKTCLLVSSDLDWTRYLTDKIHWLPKLGEEPETAKQLELRLGFPISETNIISYKSIFGDPSDNITNIAPLNERNIEQFKELTKIITEPLDMIFQARKNTSVLSEDSLLKSILINERQYLINTQLTSAIPCDESYLLENTVRGRDDKTLYKMLREILELEVTKKKFTFGKIKRPRVVGN